MDRASLIPGMSAIAFRTFECRRCEGVAYIADLSRTSQRPVASNVSESNRYVANPTW
jgi:hypothetical protein